MKNVLLVVAAAALLSACGNPETPEVSLEEGPSVWGGVVIDYGSDANLLTASVFGEFSGGFIYTPHVNTKIAVVPTFAGANELDYAEVNGTRIEAKVGTAADSYDTYSGKISLEGIRYIEYLMTEEVPTFKFHSKAVTGGTLHTATLNIVDNTTAFDRYNVKTGDWEVIKGEGIDSYFKTEGTHTVEILEGAMGGFLIQGNDLENYHTGYYGYSASAEGVVVAKNTLEASINNTMKTAAIWKMPAKDLTINITMSDAMKVGTDVNLVHGAGYIGVATVGLTKDYHGDINIAAVTLKEYCLPTQVAPKDVSTLAEADYVKYAGKHGDAYAYKTAKIGDVTLTAKTVTGEDGKVSLVGYVKDGEETNWFTNVENQKTYVNHLVNGGKVVYEVSTGNIESDVTAYDKDVNGYGGTTFDWKANRDATVAMVMTYGTDASLAAVRQTEAGEDGKKYWVVKDGEEDVVTGATWTDLNTVKEGSTSYVQLIKNAEEAAKAMF